MKILDLIIGKIIAWVRKDKIKAISEPKEIVQFEVGNAISPEEKFRNEISKEAELSKEEIYDLEIKKIRKEQICIASKYVLTGSNLTQIDIKRGIEYYIMQPGYSISGLMPNTTVILSDLDLITLKQINMQIQKEPNLINYLNGKDNKTKDNNIVEVVNRTEKEAEKNADSSGISESIIEKFMPNIKRIINELQEEQKQYIKSKEKEDE